MAALATPPERREITQRPWTVLVPSSPYFSMNSFCASENLDAFMAFRFSPRPGIVAENFSCRRSGFGDQSTRRAPPSVDA
jgi:hypothetical protein